MSGEARIHTGTLWVYGPWKPGYAKLEGIDRVSQVVVRQQDVPVTDVSFLHDLRHVRSLQIDECRPTSFEVLRELAELRSLSLTDVGEASVPWEALGNLTACHIDPWSHELHAPVLEHPNLVDLTLREFSGALLDFKEMPQLRWLEMIGYRKSSLAGLRSLPHLQGLSVNQFGRVSTLAGLEEAPQLRVLLLAGGRKLKDVSALQSLQALRRLCIDTCDQVEFGDTLSSLAALRFFKSTTPVPISALRGMLSLPVLESVQIINFSDRKAVGLPKREELDGDELWHRLHRGAREELDQPHEDG